MFQGRFDLKLGHVRVGDDGKNLLNTKITFRVCGKVKLDPLLFELLPFIIHKVVQESLK